MADDAGLGWGSLLKISKNAIIRVVTGTLGGGWIQGISSRGQGLKTVLLKGVSDIPNIIKSSRLGTLKFQHNVS